MKKRLRLTPLTISLIVLTFQTLQAQDSRTLGDVLPLLSSDAAQSYAGPIARSIGVNLNGGWFHRSPQPKFLGLTLEFGVVGMLSDVKEIDRQFSTNASFRFDSVQTSFILQNSGLTRPTGTDDQSSFRREFFDSALVSIARRNFDITIGGPTVFGNQADSLRLGLGAQTITVRFRDPQTNTARDTALGISQSALALPFGGLISEGDLPFGRIPLVMPQITVGTVLGTQATFRYLPQVPGVEGLGKYDILGYGVQHNPAVWLTPLGVHLPFELSLGYFTQTLSIEARGDENGEVARLKSKATAYGGTLSKAFGFTLFNIVPYVGYLRETASTEMSYAYVVDAPFSADPLRVPVRFDVDGGNTQRITLGVSVRFLLLNVNIDYNIANTNSITVGLMANLSFEK